MKVFGMRVEMAESIFEKMKGLMFRKKLDHALVFKLKKPTRIGASIHSFFVFFPFDIVWVRKNKVVDLREKVAPFTLNLTPKKEADFFIELPAGSIKKKKIKEGSKIKLN